MVFNDISLEHGGPFPTVLTPVKKLHIKHQCGVSIDTRYFGSGGISNTLNGEELDGDRGTERRTRLEEARDDPIAQQAMVTWILENRERMDQLAESGSIAQIVIGMADWNTRSLLDGLFPDDEAIPGDEKTPIRDLDGNPIGSWEGPGRKLIGKETGHLGHVHLELIR